MRRKLEAVSSFASSDHGLPRVVRDYRARYRAISQVLDDNPEILSAVHEDLLKLSEGGTEGREGDYTSENILRALIVQHRVLSAGVKNLCAAGRRDPVSWLLRSLAAGFKVPPTHMSPRSVTVVPHV